MMLDLDELQRQSANLENLKASFTADFAGIKNQLGSINANVNSSELTASLNTFLDNTETITTAINSALDNLSVFFNSQLSAYNNANVEAQTGLTDLVSTLDGLENPLAAATVGGALAGGAAAIDPASPVAGGTAAIDSAAPVAGGTAAMAPVANDPLPVPEGGAVSSGGPTVPDGGVSTSIPEQAITNPTPVAQSIPAKSNPANGFNVTSGNKTYDLNSSDLDLLYSIVAAESDKSYDDALAVASVILNRCEDSAWVSSFGTNPIRQATAPNQFVVYQTGAYRSFTNGRSPAAVKSAVDAAISGTRNNRYLSFRSNNSRSYSSNMITPTGNRYK